MRAGEPSRTAWSAAVYRAAHHVVDPRPLYADPLAVRILGIDESAVREGRQAQPDQRRMRMFIALRTRFADDLVLAAVGRGTRQVVVLGAGLDTTAYRHPGLTATIFEVDHPATQAWKRERLDEAGIAVPENVRFTPVDFETEQYDAALLGDAWQPGEPTFFVWLGVTPYLSRAAALDTLARAGRAPRNEIVFDYANPANDLDEVERALRAEAMERVASIGEPWRLFFETDEVARLMQEAGFTTHDDLGPDGLVERFLGISGAPDRSGAHVVHGLREP